MFAYTLARVKSKAPPLGFSRKAFLKKLRNPRASKPWRDRRAMSAGRIDVSLHSDVRRSDLTSPAGGQEEHNKHNNSVHHSNHNSPNSTTNSVMADTNDIALGNLTTLSPLGLRSPHIPPHTSLHYDQPTLIDTGAARVLPRLPASLASCTSPSPPHRLSDTSAAARGSSALQMSAAPQPTPVTAMRDAPDTNTPVLARLPMGDVLELEVNKVRTYGFNDPDEGTKSDEQSSQTDMERTGPVPIHLEHLTRTRREVAESIKVPRHINRLFHKIMGWSTELGELDMEAALVESTGEYGVSMNSANTTTSNNTKKNIDNPTTTTCDSNNNSTRKSREEESTLQPRCQARALADAVKYGVLLASYEKDQFALNHRLQLAGTHLERRFLEWEGMHVLDHAPAAQLAQVHRDKSAVVLDTPSASAYFHVPVIGRDCCSGCGALLQSESSDDFGHATEEEVARYVMQRNARQRVRHEYATRMAELQAHWRTHGRRVGEEWLDFMTQEEFDAFYRAQEKPFVCRRCHTIDVAQRSDTGGDVNDEPASIVSARNSNRNGACLRRCDAVWSAPDFAHKLSTLREQCGVVLLVVDVTDFPGSMVRDLAGVVSMNHRVVIAVNKMDCVRNRSFDYRNTCHATARRLVSMRHVCRWVRQVMQHHSRDSDYNSRENNQSGNNRDDGNSSSRAKGTSSHSSASMCSGLPRHVIEAIVPVSARRGWNIESLLLSLEAAANWNMQRPGPPLPVYVVGVTNVGKSSLVNALASHLQPPTPPHPQSRKIYYTLTDPSSGAETVRYRWYTPPNVNRAEMVNIGGQRAGRGGWGRQMTVSTLPGTTVAVSAVRLTLRSSAYTSANAKSHDSVNDTSHNSPSGACTPYRSNSKSRDAVYLYDTPGILPQWHASSPLTLRQMRRTLMRDYRNPQCFLLSQGHTLFLGGLAAVEVVSAPKAGLLMMVYTSSKVRNAIVRTEYADTFWREQLGKALDPPGSLEQLRDFMLAHTADPIGNDKNYSNMYNADNTRFSGKSYALPSSACMGVAVAEPGLRESRTYYWECFARHRRRPRADIYVCGLGWVSFCVSEPADVVMRVRTVPGVVHGVREPLRYNDLGAFRRWPKLRRRNTSRGLREREDEVDAESVGTVVHLTEGPMAGGTASALGAMRARERRMRIGDHILSGSSNTNDNNESNINYNGNITNNSINHAIDTTSNDDSSSCIHANVSKEGGRSMTSQGVKGHGIKGKEDEMMRAGDSKTGRDASTQVPTLNDAVTTLPRVPKSVHPRHAVSSSEPLESLIMELRASGSL